MLRQLLMAVLVVLALTARLSYAIMLRPDCAATYYVCNLNGSDAAAGVSPESAWLSLERLQRLHPTTGSLCVLLCRAGVWQDTTLKLARVEQSSLILSSYGDVGLPRPQIELSRSCAESMFA